MIMRSIWICAFSIRLEISTSSSRLSKRDGAHFFEVHSNRVVRSPFSAFGKAFQFFGFFFAFSLPLYLGLVEDLDVHSAQIDQNLIDLIRRIESHREDFVNFLVSDVPLLFGEGDQLIDFLLMLLGKSIFKIGFTHAFLKK